MSLIDGLDTMWIMGLQDEFKETLPLISNMTFKLEQVRMILSNSNFQTHVPISIITLHSLRLSFVIWVVCYLLMHYRASLCSLLVPMISEECFFLP